MSIDLWISVLLAIPLAIIANLATPHLRIWIDQKAEHGRRRKREKTVKQKRKTIKELKETVAVIEELVTDRSKYREFLLETLVRVALYGAIGGIIGGIANTVFIFSNQLANNITQRFLVMALASFSQLAALLVAILIFRACSDGLSTIRRVKNFNDFRSRYSGQIAAIEAGLHYGEIEDNGR